MDHFYKSIHGNFTFAEFYAFVAKGAYEAEGEWHGVEVGALQGQSASFLAVEMGGYGALDLVEIERSNCDAIERNFAGRRGLICAVMCMPSVNAAAGYEDSYLDFVMLDAGHEYADLRSDIDAWYPKVKPGGILATHDFCHYFPGLMRAWCESFPQFNVWPGSLWPEDGDARPDARADLVNRSALKKDTDFMPVAWIRK